MSRIEEASPTAIPPAVAGQQDISRLRDLSPQQWKSGLAAWLGWLFDGLDMHLYTLVALPFVAELIGTTDLRDPQVSRNASLIQAAFLVGWALGGGFFGLIGDRLGRSRALVLTILTYALFTGLSFFAQDWWHLLIFRFLAALGIGGEWAVGASLLSETWPKRWRPWIAAVLQTAVNIGVLLAAAANFLIVGQEEIWRPWLAGFMPADWATALVEARPERFVFLVGVLPAAIVLWIRRAVPEPEEWHAAKERSANASPPIADLFRGDVRRITWLTILVCSLSLSAHWAFAFWSLQHLRNLTDVASWTDAEKSKLVSQAFILLMVGSIAGNFIAAVVARRLRYRRAISGMLLAYFLCMLGAYGWVHDHQIMLAWMPALGAASGLFALFTMYMPPLFPTLLRTTGAGFCYNIGRIAAAIGTVVFGLFQKVGDFRMALLYAGFLFLPAAAVALMLPEPPDEAAPVEPLE
jgi:MFS family permease